MRKIDLSSRANLPSNGNTVPSFTPVNHYPGQLVFAGAGTSDLFVPKTAVTIRRVVIQLSAATTLQLLINNEPASPVLTLPVNALISFPGLFLPNNAKLQILSTAAVTLSYDVVYLIGVHNEQIVTDLHVSGLASSGGGATSNVNLIQQNTVALSSPTADAPVGTEVAPVVRIIAPKRTTIETTTPLAANGIFIGAWHDTELDGNLIVTALMFSNVVSAVSGVLIQSTNDQSNANLTRTVALCSTNAGTINTIVAVIRDRFWRVKYTNGATLQANFELTTTASNNFIPINEGSNSGAGAVSVPTTLGLQAALSAADNQLNYSNSVAAAAAPIPFVMQLNGGRFSGAADAVRQGTSIARTPTVFRRVSSAATGSTVIWTPGTGNKFRLLGYRIQVTGKAIAAAGADLLINLLDSALDLNQGVMCSIPTVAGTAGVLLDTGWVSLGTFGILSAAVNQALNINLSFALTGGLVNVTTQGTEE